MAATKATPARLSKVQAVLDQQINRKNGGDQRPPHVDGDCRLGPLFERRHDVLHAPKGHDLVCHHPLRWNVVDGDVHVASQQRHEQQDKNIARLDTDFRICVFEDAELHEHQHENENDEQDQQERPREGEVMHVRDVHRLLRGLSIVPS